MHVCTYVKCTLTYVCILGVDFSCKAEDVMAHFASCGAIKFVTILVDKFTARPKGYVEVGVVAIVMGR